MSVGTAVVVIVSVAAIGTVPTVAERTSGEAFFDVEITEAPEVIAAGNTVVVKANVTNTGDETGTQQIHLKNTDHEIVDSIASPPLTLSPGESQNVTLAWQTTEETQSGNFSVQSDDDYPHQYVEVRDGPSFAFSTNVTAETDDRLNVSVNVTNTGDMVGTTSAWIAVDEQPKDMRQLTLQPGESRQVELSWRTAGTLPGEWNVTVGLGNSSTGRVVEISHDIDVNSTIPLVVDRSNAAVEGTTATVVGHDVTTVEFTAPVDGRITVDQLDGLPEEAGSVTDAVGLYRITVPANASETGGTMTVTINESRLEGAATESIILKHWNGSAWTSLDTQVSLDNGTVTVTAPTQNFSLFAVTTGNELEPATQTPTATATATEGETTTSQSETATSTHAATTETDSPGFGGVAALIGVLLGALLLTNTRRD